MPPRWLEYKANVFSLRVYTALYALHALHATRSGHDKAVRPSVRPSDKRVICDNTKETYAHILIPHETAFALVL